MSLDTPIRPPIGSSEKSGRPGRRLFVSASHGPPRPAYALRQCDCQPSARRWASAHLGRWRARVWVAASEKSSLCSASLETSGRFGLFKAPFARQCSGGHERAQLAPAAVLVTACSAVRVSGRPAHITAAGPAVLRTLARTGAYVVSTEPAPLQHFHAAGRPSFRRSPG